MFDYHIHTRCSFDSQESMVAYAQAAVRNGVRELCFTDHHELDYPIDTGFSLTLDLNGYFEDLRQVREQMPQLTIRSGVEAALLPHSLNKIERDLRQWEFDFIIASQHVAQGQDPYYGHYYDDMDLLTGQRLYLEDMLYTIQRFDHFDVIGHIGYIDRYLDKYPQLKNARPFTWHDFPDLIDAILKSAISRGKGIEINTSYARSISPLPHESILRRFAELGGEVVTTGSDAHSAEKLAYAFPEAHELLRACGLRYVCTFEKHTPTFHKL